jgi:multiple sugar transport system ATP-binding protein
MAFPLQIRKVSKEDTKKSVREAPRLLGVDGLLDRKPKELSGGSGSESP